MLCALLVLIAFYATKVLAEIAIPWMSAWLLISLNQEATREGLLRMVTAISMVGSSIAAMIGVILSAHLLFGRMLRKKGPGKPAWVIGDRDSLTRGLNVGTLIAIVSSIILLAMPTADLRAGVPLETGIGIFAYFMSVILAAFTEELIFRGVLFGAAYKMGGKVCAYLFTTTAFVLLHYVDGRPFFAATLITSILFSTGAFWVRNMSNAIGPAIVLHLINNVIFAAIGVIVTHL